VDPLAPRLAASALSRLTDREGRTVCPGLGGRQMSCRVLTNGEEWEAAVERSAPGPPRSLPQHLEQGKAHGCTHGQHDPRGHDG
jgi:hypothetical protein